MVDQNFDSQLDALRKAGAARVCSDTLSSTARSQLQACSAHLNSGDVIAVYSTTEPTYRWIGQWEI